MEFSEQGIRSRGTATSIPSLLGKTNPVTLDATLVGSVVAHPFTKRGAIGFSASGTFDRSTFGMMHLLQPLWSATQ